MTNEEISRVASMLRGMVAEAETKARTINDALSAIQSLCPHERTYSGMSDGMILRICHTCGYVISTLYPEER